MRIADFELVFVRLHLIATELSFEIRKISALRLET